MVSRLSYFLSKNFLTLIFFGLFFGGLTAGYAKEPLGQFKERSYLNDKYISDYIINGLLSPEQINNVTGETANKIKHSSTFLWRGPVSFSYQGEGVKNAGIGAFFAVHTPMAIAGLAVKQVSKNADIQFIIQDNLIEETIKTGAKNLNEFSLPLWLHSEVRKQIPRAKNKKCFWISYPNNEGVRFKAIVLLNSEMGHTQTYKCTEKAILEILGFYNFYKNNQYHRILDLIAIQVLYDLFNSESPLEDISPKTIRQKVKELVSGGKDNGYLSPGNVSKYIIDGLKSSEVINQATGRFGKKVDHPSTFLWGAPLRIEVAGDSVSSLGAGVSYALHTPLSVTGLLAKQVSRNSNFHIIIHKNITEETIKTNGENLKKFGVSTGARRRLLEDVLRNPQQKCYWKFFPGRMGNLQQSFIIIDASLGNIRAYQCAEKAVSQNLGFYNFHRGRKYYRILDLLAIRVLYDLFKNQSPLDDISPETIRAKLTKTQDVKRKLEGVNND